MAIARYDPYIDSFIYEDSKTSTSGTATISIESMPKNIIQTNVVELSSECIDKIADAVVKKLSAAEERVAIIEKRVDCIAYAIERIAEQTEREGE